MQQAILIFTTRENQVAFIRRLTFVELCSYRAHISEDLLSMKLFTRFSAGVDAVFFRMSLSHAERKERFCQLDRYVST